MCLHPDKDKSLKLGTGLRNLSTESEVMSNERRFQKSLNPFEIESDLPPIIFNGNAIKIKRVLQAYNH